MLILCICVFVNKETNNGKNEEKLITCIKNLFLFFNESLTIQNVLSLEAIKKFDNIIKKINPKNPTHKIKSGDSLRDFAKRTHFYFTKKSSPYKIGGYDYEFRYFKAKN